MAEFLSLPTEIRYEIYRHLRTDRSLSLSPRVENPVVLGYVSYGFHPQILTTNHQICYEAKQVFYGENHWTLFVTPDIHFKMEYFKLAPLSSALPFIRRVQVRFQMLDCLILLYHFGGVSDANNMVQLREKLNQISKTLAKARSLHTCSLIWTETRPFSAYSIWEWTTDAGEIVRAMQDHIEKILQPLCTLKPSCTIQKSEQIVKFRSNVRSTAMEKAFSNAVDALKAGRVSSA